MSLSCSCGNDYEWYYEISEVEYTANSAGRCYGCGCAVCVGESVARIWSFTLDEEGAETEFIVLGRMCEKCVDMIENLEELGYCLSANKGFVKTAHEQYLKLLPQKHVMRSRK